MKKQDVEKTTLKNLTAPIKVGPFELKNRMVLSPMNETMSGMNGESTDQCNAYFGARAKGGAGMLITGAIMATKLASEFVWGRNLYCFHSGHQHGLSMLTDQIHYFGSLACAQMTMGFGRQGHSRDHHALAPAPTAGLPYEIANDRDSHGPRQAMIKSERARSFLVGQLTREMSIDEIHSEQKEYAASCQLAVSSGFDGIEIHAPHGYLEHEFLSPLTNRRTDMYGGDWHGRKRLLMEIMEQVRYACPDAIVGVRISAHEHVEGGLTTEEMIDVALDLEARGADYISLSDGGGYEDTAHLVGTKEVAAHIPDSAANSRKSSRSPLWWRHSMIPSRQTLISERVNLIFPPSGDSSLSIPNTLTRSWRDGLGDINICKRCNTCLVRCLSGLTPACPFNKNLGREYALPEYQIGPWQKHEALMPRGAGAMPSLDRPWWKSEVPVLMKHWRKFRGPGPVA